MDWAIIEARLEVWPLDRLAGVPAWTVDNHTGVLGGGLAPSNPTDLSDQEQWFPIFYHLLIEASAETHSAIIQSLDPIAILNWAFEYPSAARFGPKLEPMQS